MSDRSAETLLAAPLVCIRGADARRFNVVPLALVATSLACWAIVVWAIARLV
jgi:hypothetical protein